jgi:hypothetical protein
MNWQDHAVRMSVIVAVGAVSRKRDRAPDFGPRFDIAPQQKASHIAAASRMSLARISFFAHRDAL